MSIVVPCYNEEKNLFVIFEEFTKLVEDVKQVDFELVLVNNGSSDNTKVVMENLLTKSSGITIVTIENNKGYGHGLMEGIKNATGEYISWLHADLQIKFEEIKKIVEMIERGVYPQRVFIKGERNGRSTIDRFFTWGMSFFETIYLRYKLYDIGAIPVCFHKIFLPLILNPPTDFSIELYFYYIAQKNNFKIIRFPVAQYERCNGSSSWNRGIFSKIKQSIVIMKRSVEMDK